MEIRVGQGYDIHQLIDSNKGLTIGVCNIPFDKTLNAHSDGDVLIHSIIDSLLGAANLGDIGTHFPDNDPNYKGIDSSILLKGVLFLLKQKSYKIINIDTTIVCERPKLKDYIPSIKKRLAELLNIEIDQISIKAKTKEKLDSVGEERAIEVFSICLIQKI